jgi:hypothetical protein
VELPRLLKRIEQGKTAWRVRHGSREVSMLSPVSGRVIEKNEMVRADPSLLNSSPYGDGWLLRVRPRRLAPQLCNLFTGKAAQLWLDAARSRLAGFFASTPALMYQDGGVMMTNLSDRCSDDEWDRIAREFFLNDEHTKQS